MTERILVVDDDELVLTAIHALLKQEGFDVQCCERGGPALAMVEAQRFDLAVLDVRMPGISGIELLDHIRQLEEKGDRPRLPVLILTAFGDDDVPIEALRLSADDFLMKPFARDNFMSSVRRLLARGRRERDKHAYTEDLEDKVEQTSAELESSRQQLRHASRLATVGQLSASVAHELNSPLAVIASYADLILSRLEKTGEGSREFRDSMKLILDEAARCGGMVKNLLRFSAESNAELSPLDLASVLDKTVAVLSHTLEVDNVELVRELPAELPWAQGNESQLQQVFTNLILNAKNAMRRGGRLTIRGQGLADDAGDRVELAFADDGRGVPAEDLERIFQPFFSTRPTSTSMGLGLSISREIVAEHHGELVCESVEGEGATFFVRLPRAKLGGGER